MNSELLKVIEAEAAAERQRITDAARERAGEIISSAETAARRLRDSGERARDEQERAVRLKTAAAAELAASALRLEAKRRVLDSVFDAARRRLAQLSGPEYRRVLKSLIAEAAAGFDGQFRLRVRRQDAKPAAEILKELGLEAEAEAEGADDGGVVASDPQGRMMVCNRFADRLERARPELLPALSRILWG